MGFIEKVAATVTGSRKAIADLSRTGNVILFSTWRESGIFNAVSGGTMLYRALFSSAFTKDATKTATTQAKVNVAIKRSGLDANKGAPQYVGDGYLATDTLKIYYSSDGSTWNYALELIGNDFLSIQTVLGG